MNIQNKPDYKIFADGAKPGEVVAFPDVLRGWGVTLDTTGGIPPMEFFNSFGKRLNEWLMYLTQRGIPEWDALVDYPKSSMVQTGDVFYVSLKQTKNENPATSQQSWSTLKSVLGVDNKLDKSAVVQSAGQSTTQVMSQKAVTDSLSFSNEAWKNMKNERKAYTNYTNSTLKPIMVSVQGNGARIAAYVNNVTILVGKSGTDYCSFIVPPGATYSVSCSSILIWVELR